MQSRLGDPHLHFWLTRSVGRAMGLNFTDEMANSRLTAKTYSDMVTQCRGCHLVNACQSWLSQQSAVAKTAPPGCRNTKVLESLARPN